jgi:hypothetical protein
MEIRSLNRTQCVAEASAAEATAAGMRVPLIVFEKARGVKMSVALLRGLTGGHSGRGTSAATWATASGRHRQQPVEVFQASDVLLGEFLLPLASHPCLLSNWQKIDWHRSWRKYHSKVE